MADGPSTGRRADLALTGIAALLERLPTNRPSLAVLTYHRVDPAGDRPDLHPGLCVGPATFEAQMRFLTAYAHPVGLGEVLAAATGGADLPRRAVHVTFDDAYRGVEDHAWPVLRALGVPATTFVPTAYPDQDRSFWWDRLSNAVRHAPGPTLEVGGAPWPVSDDRQRAETFSSLRASVAALPHAEAMALIDEVVGATGRVGVLDTAPATSTWAGLTAMAAEGLTLAPHSQGHPFLDRITPAELDDEVGGSFAELRRRTDGPVPPAFAYPSGVHDDAIVAAARRAGVRLGFTTERGVIDLRRPDWLRLPRINVGRRASPALVRVQLTAGPHTARTFARTVTTRARTLRRHTSRRTSWN